MRSIQGYMTFMCEAPIVGLDPQPGNAPGENDKTDPLEFWKDAYFVHEDRKSAEQAVADFAESMKAEVAAGNLQDFEEEFVLPVVLFEDGSVHVHDRFENAPMRIYTAADMLGAFGIDPEGFAAPGPIANPNTPGRQ